jgi:hypothetical protein
MAAPGFPNMELTPETVEAIQRLKELREQLSKGLTYVARFSDQMQALVLADLPDAEPGASAAVQAKIREIAVDVEGIPVLRKGTARLDGEAKG